MSVITIDASSLAKGAAQLLTMGKEISDIVDNIMTTHVEEMAGLAKRNAPGNFGFLRGQINPKTDEYLKKEVTVNAFYAPYMEFGTGKYAAQEVAKLPANWAAYAATFKGSAGSGTFFDFLVAIKEWVKKKGIGVSYNVSTRRKNRQTNAEIEDMAYMIAMSILRNGVRPHPFLFPAYKEQSKQLKTDLEAAIKEFIK